jgi:hypothetical protein
MAQRQRRDGRDNSHYPAISGKSRLRGASEPLSAGAGVGQAGFEDTLFFVE